MSRSANETNAEIFSRLAGYAADHDVAIPVGQRRVFLERDDYDILTGSRRIKHFPIGRQQAAALLETPSGDVLVVSGFDAEDAFSSSHVREIEISPGLVVAALADLEINPLAGPVAVYNVVAAGKSGDDGYRGHELQTVQSLFPRLRALEVDADVGGSGNFTANLLTVCAAEGAGGNGWINEALAVELVRLAEQRIAGFPYEFLIMASLELDPRNLFLALYRCLEATYAYTRASELANRLGISDKSWFEVAKALGESLSWYPRHDQSLAAVLSLSAVSRDDLDALAASLGKDQGGDEVATRVATGVRELRNSLVHFGPTTRPAAVPDDDWNRVCTPLARVVGSVFAHTYGGVAVGSGTADLGGDGVEPVRSAPQPTHSYIRRGAEGLVRLVRGHR